MTLCFRCPSSVVNIGSEFRSVVAAVSVAIAGFWSENQRFRQGSLRSCPNATKSLDKQAHSVLGVVHYSLLQKRSDSTFLLTIYLYPLRFLCVLLVSRTRPQTRCFKGNVKGAQWKNTSCNQRVEIRLNLCERIMDVSKKCVNLFVTTYRCNWTRS